jgi:hypothetical protein
MKTAEIKTLKISLPVWITTILIMLTGCPTPCDDCPNHMHPYNPESYVVGPEGGTFQALDGNVRLIIPESALDEELEFTIKEGPEDYYKEFVIKSIEINPRSAIFNKPVGLSLKYSGELSCGLDPCSADCLVLYKFKNDAEFDKRNPTDMLWIKKCNVNPGDECLETEIYSGGVFAIGEESLGKPKSNIN